MFLTALLVVYAQVCPAGYRPRVPTLQPFQITSPDGAYLFEVKPTHRYGSGPSMATLSKGGTKEVVWKRELPFTFWQACVNNDGKVGGFAYSKGPMGGDPWTNSSDDNSAGDFLVRLLDRNGTSVFEETSRRGSTFGPFTGSVPPLSPDGLMFNSEDNSMLIRIGSVFRNYSLDRACLESAIIPVVEGFSPNSFYVAQVKVIPKSPLLLLQMRYNKSDEIEGANIAVMDQRGKLIWSVKHENKIRHEDNVVYRGSVRYNLLSVSSITPAATDVTPLPIAECDVYFGNTEERVTYRILRTGPDEDIVWSVTETKRAKWTLPHDDDEAPPVNIPPAESKKLAEFQLSDAGGKPLDEIKSAVLGPSEQIYALHTDGTVHVFNRDGKSLHLCKPGAGQEVETGFGESLTVNEQGDVFVKLNASDAEKPNPWSGHFLHFSPDGTLHEKPAPSFEKDSPEQWFAQPKSKRFVVGRWDKAVLARRDDDQWSHNEAITHRADGHWLEFIDAVCFAPDGTIAIRDRSLGNDSGGFFTPFPLPPSHLPMDTITIFQPDGTPIRTIDFTAGKNLSRIAFDGTRIVAAGGFDVPNPFVYVFKATGEVVGAIRIDGLSEKETPDFQPFIVENGTAILVIEKQSGRCFRFAMPK